MYIKTLQRKCKHLPAAHATHTGPDNALAKRPHAKALYASSVVSESYAYGKNRADKGEGKE